MSHYPLARTIEASARTADRERRRSRPVVVPYGAPELISLFRGSGGRVTRMRVETDQLETPPGARPIGEARRSFLHIPAIKVRQAAQADDEPPTFVRSRFGWSVQEVSGSLGDLGTFLPHIIGAITIVRMDPTGILTTFGLFYACRAHSTACRWPCSR